MKELYKSAYNSHKRISNKKAFVERIKNRNTS
jgi:hypothetical protein